MGDRKQLHIGIYYILSPSWVDLTAFPLNMLTSDFDSVCFQYS